MPAIETHELTKVYRTYKKAPGIWGAIKGLGRREYEEVRAADGVTFSIEEGEFVGLSRAEWRGQDDGAQDAFRPAQSHERFSHRARLHAVGAQGRNEAAVFSAHGPEKRAVVGSAGARIAGIESRDLRHRPQRAIETDRRRADGTARRARTSSTSWCANCRSASG